jgi:predicted RNA binding protein YcfA (HicA-like mRNA interferase family)
MPRIVPIHYRKLVRILEMEGFSLARERGDHMIFTKPGVERPAVVPRYDSLPVFVIKNVLRTAHFERKIPGTVGSSLTVGLMPPVPTALCSFGSTGT